MDTSHDTRSDTFFQQSSVLYMLSAVLVETSLGRVCIAGVCLRVEGAGGTSLCRSLLIVSSIALLSSSEQYEAELPSAVLCCSTSAGFP